jgi:outer membrane protein TolC
VIILDVNKARLQLLEVQNEQALNENKIQVTATRLASLNGGIPVTVTDTTYPVLPAVPSFEVLDSLIEANDPELQVYEGEKQVLQKQADLQRALNLPKIETGYHSQGILGQSYRGLHAGITIPLWENRNRLKAVQAELDHATVNAEAKRIDHRLENRQLYEQLEIRRTRMLEYHRVLSSLNNTALLDKALRLGQITIIQFFADQNYYFGAYDRYLQLELEYQKAVAALYKFQL